MADPYTTPIPGATGYESATLAAKTAYQNALTRLNQQRGDTLRQFGYAGDIDPSTGVVNNVRVDANLPFGQYQQDRRQHADQYEQERASAQDRGLGHGGLAAHGVTQLRQGFGADDAALGTGLSGSLSGFQDQQNQAKYSQDSALAEAQLQQTRDAIQAQMFDQANLDGLDVPEGPDWGSIIQGLLGGGDGAPTAPPPGASAKTPVSGAAKNASAYIAAATKTNPVYVHSAGAVPAPPKKKTEPAKKTTTNKAV
jgi:hypothetical protein